MNNLSNAFDAVNQEVGQITANVSQTPASFLPSVYSLIRNISENVILPVAGIILTPIGMIAGSFLGAFLAELLWAKKDPTDSLRAAFGSFLGFMLGTGLKTIAACLIMWQIIVYAF